jgi:tetratricopeptide (TPR) repeat protein
MKNYSRLLVVGLIVGLLFSGAVAQTQTDGDTVAQLREQVAAATMIPDRNRLQLKLAEELVKTGYKTEALAELFSVLNGKGFDPTGYYNLGNAFARLGESGAAITAYQRAIEQRNGNYSRAQNNLGVVLLREGRWDEAYNAFNAALRIENFRYAEASYNLGRLYAARGQSDLAVREWRRALAADPKHSAAAQAIARGEDEPEIVVEKAPRAASPATATTTARTAPAPPKAAAASRPGRLALDQMSFDYLQRARAASERGKMEEAIDNFRRVLNRQNGYFPPANLELSYALLSLKRYDEAEAQLLQVSQRDGSRYPVSYFHLARLYEAKGELKRAEAAFSQVVDAYVPKNNQFLLDLSRVREKQGDFKGAVEAMERYVSLAEQQGLKPSWCDQRLAELRAKAQ